MKLTQITLALAAVLSTATAQGLGDLPDCAKSCATSSLPANCGIDVSCICKSQTFLSNIACCVADKCNKQEQEATLQAAKSICARGGVTDLPNTVSCSTTAATSNTASETTLSGSATATTNTEASTTATGASASSTAASSSASSSSSSTVSSAASSASSAATTTGAAVLGQNRDSSLMAAAGAAAAFAILI